MNTVLFGGTFSPPHIGHISSVTAVLKQCLPDRVIIVPTGMPPHKNEWGCVSGNERYEMCKAAFSTLSNRVSVSDYEIRKCGKSYTYDTVSHFKELYPGTELSLLCGEDMIMCLDTWYRASDLMKKCSFKAVLRHGDGICAMTEKISQLKKDFNAEIEIVETETVDISSGKIRELIRTGCPYSDYVCDEVYGIIQSKHLYICQNGGSNDGKSYTDKREP